MRKKYESAFGLVFRKKKTPNKHFNLTYLAVTTLAKQGSRQPKRRLSVALEGPSGQGRRKIESWALTSISQ